MSVTDDIRAAEAAAQSNRLPELAVRIKDAIVRGKTASYDLCVALGEAKTSFPATQAFTKWLAANDIIMDPNERSSAIEMAQDLELLRQVLATTKFNSLRRICEDDFRRHRAGPNCNQNAKPTTKSSKEAVQFEKALAVAKQHKAAGGTMLRDEIAKEAGVGAATATAALNALSKVNEAMADAATIEDINLSASAQKKFDAKLKAYQKKLDEGFEAAVRKESDKRSEELGLPHYFKVLKEVKSWLESSFKRGGIMSRKDFISILACLHPDSNGRSKERLQEAFVLFKKHEDMIVMDKAAPRIAEIYDMPKTREEMTARRRKKN